MPNATIFSVFIAILLASVPAMADITYGMASDTILQTYPCRKTYSGDCRFAIDQGNVTSDMGTKRQYGGPGVYDTLTHPNGSAYASAQFQQDLLLPELKAYALDLGHSPVLPNIDPTRYTGATGTMVDANVFTVSRYKYNGLYPDAIRFSTRFSSIFSSVGALEGHSTMRVAAFTSSSYQFDVDSFCPIGTKNTYNGCTSNSTLLALAQTTLTETSTSLFQSFFIYVNPGDEFYIGAFLDANVCCGGSVDSSHTLSMRFDDISNLELLPVLGAPIADVDEPPAHLLVILGLAAIMLRSKRRNYHEQ